MTSSTSKAALVAWAFYDWANSAFAAIITTFVFAAYFTRSVAENTATGSAQWGNTLGIAGFAVAVTGPVLGAVADQGGRRKPWVAAFTGLCVAATALLWFIKPDSAYIGFALLLVGLGTLGAEFAFIFYNAMLPGLVRPDQVGRWSGWGWSMGYAGGVICLIIALVVFIQSGEQWFGLDSAAAEPVRATFPLVSCWYFLFALPLFLITPDTPGSGRPFAQAVRAGIGQLRDSIRHVRRYRPLVRFLVARMFYIDGLATLFAFGGVYAAGTFNMTEEEILLFGVALNITAGLGAAGFAWVDDWLGSKPTILLSLGSLIILGTLVLLVHSLTLFWVIGLLLGVFVGPAQAASRSFVAHAAPEPMRNEIFGLFALSGKVTAFLGPLLVGWGTYLSGSQRIGMSVIVIFFLIGFLLMLTVPGVKKAQPVHNSLQDADSAEDSAEPFQAHEFK